MPAWAELEAAQVMANERFSHDLVFESVQANMLESVRRWLNRRAAEVLEASGVRGARVAEHWLAGFEPVRAAPQWLAAAEQAVAALRLSEAADFFAQAADAFESNNDFEAAFEARYAELRQRLEVDASDRMQSSSERLRQLARTPRQRAQARLAEAMFLSIKGRFSEIEAVAQAGLEDAVLAGDLKLEADLLEALVSVPMTVGKP